MNRGWVKTWREDVMNNPRWPGNTGEPFSRYEADEYIRVLAARGVENGKLKKDQAEVSERSLAKIFKWDKMKVRRLLKELEEEGVIQFESKARSRLEMSIITVLRRSEREAVSEAVKPLKQRSLCLVSEAVSDASLKKLKEANTGPRAESGPEGCVDRVLGHCLEKGPWKGFRVQNSEDAARTRITKRLDSGYTEEDLIRYVDVYLGRRRAHIRFKNGHDGEPPSPTHRLWCPNPTWSIEELFTRQRYFVKWIDDGEEVLTLEKIERIEDQEYGMM